MDSATRAHADPALSQGVPLPIVTLTRSSLVVGVAVALALRLPWLTTLLFLMLLAAVLFGPRGNLFNLAGARLFAKRLADAAREDPRLMRFNNLLALVLLGLAQVAFAFGIPFLGWIAASFVAAAAGLALSGFCLGCFLYHRLRMERYRLFGR